MGGPMCIFYVICILTWNQIVTTSGLSQTVQQTTFTSGSSQFNALFAQTAALETRLNEEIAKREALEKEVQSKNDLTEFLRQDVQMMNRTLGQETVRRNQLDAKLAQVESVVKNLQSTLAEDRGLVPKLSRDLQELDTRLTNQIRAVNGSLQTVMTSSDLNSAMIQNLSTLLSESNGVTLNQTRESIQTSINLLNQSLQYKLSNISSAFSSLSTNLTINGNMIDSLTDTVAKQQVKLVDLNGTIGLYEKRFGDDIALLNKSNKDLSIQCAASAAAINASVDDVRAELGRFQSTSSTKLDLLTRDVTNVKTTVDHYVILTGDYNKTLNTLSAMVNQPGQTGNAAAVYFFARKPTTLTLGTNQPPYFMQVSASSGSTFDASKSLFMCSIPGIYMFTVTIQKDETEPNPRIQCWLKRNGQLLVAIDAHSAFIGSSPSASNSAVLRLSQRDVVQLTQCTGNAYLASTTTSFNGVLLHTT